MTATPPVAENRTETAAHAAYGILQGIIAKIAQMPMTGLAMQGDVASLASAMAHDAASDATYVSPDFVRHLLGPDEADMKGWAVRLVDQFIAWRKQSDDVCRPLPRILTRLASEIDGVAANPLYMPAMMACVLGSLPMGLPFHNHHHIREVVCLVITLTHAEHARRPFTDYPSRLLENVIAACIHDFAHDGRGNLRMGKHTPMRLEQQSLDHAEAYLKAAGLSASAWARIVPIVLCTDVSKINEPDEMSPADWVRKAYRRGAGTIPDGCPLVIAPIFTDRELAAQAMLMEEADIGISAGLDYSYARRMTALIADETGVLSPSPETLIGFIDHICHQEFVTDAGTDLFSANLMQIRAKAKQETADTIYNWS